MDVSIIIVNYNTKQITEDCITSIKQKTVGLDYEIILVDNASTDGSVELFSGRNDILFLPQSKNLGFGKANNKGVDVAKGKYLFFLNSDTILQNNAVKIFFDYAESCTSNIGGIGCLLTGADGNRTHSFAKFPNAKRIIRSRILSPLYRVLKKKLFNLDEYNAIKEDSFDVDYVTGADLFAKKSIIDRYGAFDPDFFMYFEETEMQFRWTKFGYPSKIITSPKIMHLEGGSVKNAYDGGRNVRKMFMVQESEFIYFKKTMSLFSYLFFRFVFLLVRMPFFLSNTLNKEQKKQYFRLLVRRIK